MRQEVRTMAKSTEITGTGRGLNWTGDGRLEQTPDGAVFVYTLKAATSALEVGDVAIVEAAAGLVLNCVVISVGSVGVVAVGFEAVVR